MGVYVKKKTKEEYAEISRNWRANNPEALKAINKKWYKNNKDFLNLKKQINKNE